MQTAVCMYYEDMIGSYLLCRLAHQLRQPPLCHSVNYDVVDETSLACPSAMLHCISWA